MDSDLFSKIEFQLSNKLPFVVYRKPKKSIITAILQHDNQLRRIEDYSEVGFVLAPFDSQPHAYYIQPDEILQEAVGPTSVRVQNTTTVHEDYVLKQNHIELVKKGIDAIETGDFEKVVLSRSIRVECSRAPLELFKTLMYKYDSALKYLWYHPKLGMWLGATPEILLRVDNNRFTTMSLAGTRPFNQGTQVNWGQKEKVEQKLVTNYISNALKNVVANLEISKTETVRAGNLWHLRTKLSGTLNDNLAEVVAALHPTPAVCGLPLKPAKDFILENEKYDRSFYTGFLGELNLKIAQERTSDRKNVENKAYRSFRSVTEFFVNLRCAQLHTESVTVYVGGGITKDSIPELEWDETVAKSATILSIIVP